MFNQYSVLGLGSRSGKSHPLIITITFKMRLAHLRDGLVGQCVGEGMKASLKSKSQVPGIPQKPRIHPIVSM